MHTITIFQPESIGGIGGRYAVHVRRCGKLLSSVTGIETYNRALRIAEEKKECFGPQYDIIDATTEGKASPKGDAHCNSRENSRCIYRIDEETVQAEALRRYGRELDAFELAEAAKGIGIGLAEVMGDVISAAVQEAIDAKPGISIAYSITSRSGLSVAAFVITDVEGKASKGYVRQGECKELHVVWEGTPQVAGHADDAMLEDIVITRFMKEIEAGVPMRDVA